MEKITKAERAGIINQALADAGVPDWGRAGVIKKSMGVSPASASGWLSGCLPKDPAKLLLFAETYNLDLNLWVFGKAAINSVGLSESKIQSLATRLREFEIANNQRLSPERFGKLFALLMRSEEKASFLLDHADILFPDVGET